MGENPPTFDREQMRRWMENWKVVGAVIDQERAERLAAMTLAEAQQRSQALLELWQPDWRGDAGEELQIQ